MSAADLQRLIQRATPRVEDVRCPDRTDFIRRSHGHLTFKEIVDALDALEFTGDSFLRKFRELDAAPPADDAEASEQVVTAVHGLREVISGLRVLSPAWPAQQEDPADVDISEAAAEDQGEPAADDDERLKTVADAKEQGAQLFKQKDYQGAIEKYGAAIAAAPAGMEGLHALYSNRSAALLQLGSAAEALADARRCVELAPEWPKGRFREGRALRQLERYEDSIGAFEAGQALEPNNSDWPKEVEASSRLYRALTPVMARQLIFNLLPAILSAWARSVPEGEADAPGVLQLQVNADFAQMGLPKWQLVKDRQAPPKAQVRYAYVGRRGYLSNVAANLQDEPEKVAVVDLEGNALSIPEISAFLAAADGTSSALVHIDVQAADARMAAVLCAIPCGELARRFTGPHKDPPAPKGSVEAVLELQRKTGFPKSLPSMLGFHGYPGGDLNYPVVDVKRDGEKS